ncbi:hypothetical protein ACQJBY_006732 [Aegilops geniculata]
MRTKMAAALVRASGGIRPPTPARSSYCSSRRSSLSPLAATSSASSHAYAFADRGRCLPRIPPYLMMSSTPSSTSTAGTPTPRSGSGRSTPRARSSTPCSATSSPPAWGPRARWRGSPTGPSTGAAPIPPRWRRWSGPMGSTSSPAMATWRSAPASGSVTW